MIKAKVNKGEVTLECKGKGDDVITEMVVLIDAFFDSIPLKNDSKKELKKIIWDLIED